MSGIVDWVDLKAADTYANGHPWDADARLRNESPVAWHPESDGPGVWALSKWADVRTVSRQPQRFSSYRRGVMMEEIDDIMKKHLFGSREEAKNFYLELNLGGFKGGQGGDADAGEPKPVIE